MRTADGTDWQAGVMGSTLSNGTGAYAPANWVALSTDTATPTGTEHTLPMEVFSGALARAQGSYAHTNGTNVWTVTKTFTSDQIIIITKMGILTAGTGGTLAFLDLIATANLQVGDVLTVTDTVSI